MASQLGGQTPYGTVSLIHSLTDDPVVGAYLRGRLARDGINPRTATLGTWLDAVYSAWADAPHELLEKMAAQVVIKSAQLRPKEARETWGQRPEHRRMAGSLGRGTGLEAGGDAGLPPMRRGGPPR